MPAPSARFRFVPYDTRRYDLAGAAAEALGVRDLGRLHEDVLARKRAAGPEASLTYPDNLALRRVLARLPDGSRLLETYRRLVVEVLAPAFGGRIAYNHRPTFRIHMAGSPSVSNWHTDAQVTRRMDQVTAWVPFVDVEDTATLWVETGYGTREHEPVDVAYGEILLFDGGMLSHGSVANGTPVTRVSLDFRFAPLGRGLADPSLGILAGRPPGLTLPPPGLKGGY